jgi:hypothetical protein
MVGNIEANRHLYLHNAGAILVVVGQLAYSWMHSYLTAVSPMQPCTVYLRSSLALAMTLAFVTGKTCFAQTFWEKLVFFQVPRACRGRTACQR